MSWVWISAQEPRLCCAAPAAILLMEVTRAAHPPALRLAMAATRRVQRRGPATRESPRPLPCSSPH